MAGLRTPGRLCFIVSASTVLLVLFCSRGFRHEGEQRFRRDDVESTESPAEHIDPAAIDLTPLVNTLINSSQSGSRQLFSLLSVTSYSSLALHKLTLLVYNISSIRGVETSLFKRRFCYCISNDTNDLTGFTAVLLDVMGNSTSYLHELFKSASILSVTQRNNSDCIYICVMAGKMGGAGPELWDVQSITPLFNQTIVEGPHTVGNVSAFRLPFEWHQLPTNRSHDPPSGTSSMLTSRVHSTAHVSPPAVVETSAAVARITATQLPATARRPTTLQPTTVRPTTVRQTTERLTTVRPTTVRQTTVRPATERQTAVRQTTVRPTTVRQTTIRQTTVRPTTVRQTTVRPATERQTAVRQTTVRPTTVRQTTIRQTTVRPTTVRQTTIRQTTVRPTTVRQTTIRQTTVRPTTLQQTTLRLTTVRQTTVQPITLQQTTVRTTAVQPTTVRQTTVQPVTFIPESPHAELRPQTTAATTITSQPVTSLHKLSAAVFVAVRTTPPATATPRRTAFVSAISVSRLPEAHHRPTTPTAHPRLSPAPRTTAPPIRITTPTKALATEERPGCPWRRSEMVDISGVTTTVSAHKLQPCVLELCKFFSQCLCRPFSFKTRMKRYCDDSHVWYEKHTLEVCRRVRRLAFSRNLKQRCLSKMCDKL